MLLFLTPLRIAGVRYLGKRRLDQPYETAHKCYRHNQWKRKVRNHPELGKVCELCRLELDRIQKENELTGGSNKPPVRIITI
jgi:hypothetical protein